VDAESWDWSLRVFDHVDVHARQFRESVRFYEAVLAPLGIPKLAEGADWVGFPEGEPGYRDYAPGYLFGA
jgi:hypothetical protein